MTLGILLAAGASRRFGVEDKLLAEWRGHALVYQSARLLMTSGCDDCVAIVSSRAVAEALPDGMKRLQIPAGQPMSHSWWSAVQYARDSKAESLLVMLGDMPSITDGILQALIEQGTEFGNSACCLGGKRLPPAFLAVQDCLSMVVDPAADQGARALIAGIPQEALVPITDEEALDIDSRGDLQALETRFGVKTH